MCWISYLQMRKNQSQIWSSERQGISGCSSHEMVEFKTLMGGNKAKNTITTLDFRRGNFDTFRGMLRRIPWVTVLEKGLVQEPRLIFKDLLLQAQEWYIPLYPMYTMQQSSKDSRQAVWLNKESLPNLKHKKKAYKNLKQGQVNQVWRHCIQCRHGIRKAKDHLKTNLERVMKGNKKHFQQTYQHQKEDKGKCRPTARWSFEPSDKEHRESQHTQCLLCLQFNLQDIPSEIPAPWDK